MKKLYITADYNDADYGHYWVTVTDEVFEKFLPVIEAINKFEPYVRRSSFGGIDYSNWESYRMDLGELSLTEKYPHIGESLLNEFAEFFVNPIPVPEEGVPELGPHTIVSLVDVVTDEVYIDTTDKYEYSKLNDKAKGYLEEKAKLYSYKRSDGTPLHSIPYAKMTEEENRMIEEVHNLWKKYI